MRKFPQTKFPIRFTQKCDMKFWFPTMAYFLCGKLNPVPPVSARNHTPEGNGILDFLGSVHSGGRDICKTVTNTPWLWGLARAEARDSSCLATTSHLCPASLPHSDFWKWLREEMRESWAWTRRCEPWVQCHFHPLHVSKRSGFSRWNLHAIVNNQPI